MPNSNIKLFALIMTEKQSRDIFTQERFAEIREVQSAVLDRLMDPLEFRDGELVLVF